MSDSARLDEAFRSGRLLCPFSDVPDLVDLSRAVARLCGADLPSDPRVERLEGAIGASDHLILVLIDGLGANLLAGGAPFLRERTALEMRAVFPSSTVPGLTSLATGLSPARHGVPAWWTHLPDAGVTATPLPFLDRFGGRLDVAPDEVFREPTVFPRIPRSVRAFLPGKIADSVYSKYVRGGTPATGYGSLASAVDRIARRIEEATEPTFTYLYWPDLDTAEHAYGPDSPEAAAALAEADREIARLAASLGGRARVALTADHGQVVLEERDKVVLAPAMLLYGPPRWHNHERTFRGWHGGLSPDEMRVPLVVA